MAATLGKQKASDKAADFERSVTQLAGPEELHLVSLGSVELDPVSDSISRQGWVDLAPMEL